MDDYQLALLLQKEFNDEEPFIIEDDKKQSKNFNSNSRKASSLVDPQWEFIDPTPDIHVLFLQFNERFFWNKLHGVEVKWSPRMTSCAGVCVYQGRSGFCSVRLSLPLLKLRPRKDLVETLLHEMIHAFLFVTKNNRDRDGHGPEFHKHMNRINQEAGTRITVYHSFHDEVRLYQQHWWRCQGPCQHKPPFFGMVKRAMNRAPGPSDNWWANHQAVCGGKFIKVREPDKPKKNVTDSKMKKTTDQRKNGKGDIRSFFPGNGTPSSKQVPFFGGPENSKGKFSTNSTNNSFPADSGLQNRSNNIFSNFDGSHQPDIFKKPNMSNVHGFGNQTSSTFSPVVNPPVNNVFGFSDLNGPAKPKPNNSLSGQPSGKGHVLGGKAFPGGHKGGMYGGMLANKGGGTLVVSGKTQKKQTQGAKDESTNHTVPTIQPAPVRAFSGTGYVLGKGTQSKPTSILTKPPLSAILIEEPLFPKKGESLKRTSPKSFTESVQKKKPDDSIFSVAAETSASSSKSLLVSCPICNERILESVINTHVDGCIDKSPDEDKTELEEVLGKNDEVIVLSDSEDENECSVSGSHVDCPGCNMKILEKQLDSHLSLCLGKSFDEDDIVDVNPEEDKNSTNKANCPICGESFPAEDMDKHIDNCASCSVQDLSQVFDEDFSEDEEEDEAVGSPSKRVSESGEPLFPCPCCLILVEASKMNVHLDQCLV